VRLRAANPSLLCNVFFDPFGKRDHTRNLQESGVRFEGKVAAARAKAFAPLPGGSIFEA
jgi:hypothetical protein